ncbi:TetR/AcrR family transcriptional regulator [Phreatobacter stygius]|uniref:TetR/AcrR family transcriptional regulator n=1 Tax=Phreatobacter stygius TaxID=1940610 RepID=A0A4D7B8N0_9HYPH|nr:TetR/AcrR family transcriptional regulator [Phreatobacter stygius]QCI67203.1 TetR/AcrR family transcriptional regulator [Phreatobacter stygius]
MTEQKPPKRVRRTQAERTAAMRLRLADAVLETLCAVGYDRLSTGLVAAQARVSRGALSHHFPSKADMLVGGFDHLLKQWEAGRLAFVGKYATPIPLADYLRHLWYDVFSKPTYVAAIELMMAARSDAVLQDRLRGVLAEWVKKRDALWAHVIGYDDVGSLGAEIGRENFLHLNLSVLRGMAIHASFNLDDTVNDRLLEAWIRLAAASLEVKHGQKAKASVAPRGAREQLKATPKAPIAPVPIGKGGTVRRRTRGARIQN